MSNPATYVTSYSGLRAGHAERDCVLADAVDILDLLCLPALYRRASIADSLQPLTSHLHAYVV